MSSGILIIVYIPKHAKLPLQTYTIANDTFLLTQGSVVAMKPELCSVTNLKVQIFECLSHHKKAIHTAKKRARRNVSLEVKGHNQEDFILVFN